MCLLDLSEVGVLVVRLSGYFDSVAEVYLFISFVEVSFWQRKIVPVHNLLSAIQ
jgi:hypothetical protein